MAPTIITRKQAQAQGLNRFFTGKQCKFGHISERWVSNLNCLECGRAKCRDRNAKRDKAAERERLRIWKQNNRDKVRAAGREYNNRPERKAHMAAYYAANKDHHKETMRTWRDSRRDELAAYSKAWAEANPEMVRASSRIGMRLRRARKRGAAGTHTPDDLAAILTAQGNRCAYCRADLKRVKKHVDHILPLALGGSNDRTNLQYLCAPCNHSKSAKDPIVYARSIGLLL